MKQNIGIVVDKYPWRKYASFPGVQEDEKEENKEEKDKGEEEKEEEDEKDEDNEVLAGG